MLFRSYAGADRYGTAAIAAGQWPEGQRTVFVASGVSFADGLAAGPAGSQEGAPLLLVPSCGLPSVVRDAISRLSPQRVIVVGGSSAVCDQTLAELESLL